MFESVLGHLNEHVATGSPGIGVHVATLRWLVLALAIVFLLIINVAVAVLLRTGAMVVRPVEALVAATRELGRENFAYRARLDAHDTGGEFDELARAFNALAEKLQASEQRKIETLHQVALAMNHDLNNAVSIIELQLHLMSRRAAGDPPAERSLRQIHQSLERMTGTVQALRNARRIVLTDYVAGVKMLDLERSARREDEDAGKPHKEDDHHDAVAHAAGSSA
jgi:signal transduction histidine kinase